MSAADQALEAELPEVPEAKARRVRIEGNGTSFGTRIVDTETGKRLDFVRGYTLTQRAGESAKVTIELEVPCVSLECDAMVHERLAREAAAGLYAIVRQFIDDNGVSCPEATASDRVYENAPLLVKQLADMVGYYRAPEEQA